MSPLEKFLRVAGFILLGALILALWAITRFL